MKATKQAAKKPVRSRGLGDTVAKVTSTIGIKPCKGCKKRQAKLNKWFPYKRATMSDLKSYFERCYVVNLDRRPDRLKSFLSQVPADWPFVKIERFAAIDGRKCPRPTHWRAGGGAWGCRASHLAILQQCLQDGVKSVLIFEDDAVFCDGFAGKVAKFLRNVPDDWGMIYLGGQHLKAKQHHPQQVNKHTYIPYNVNRTHAFAVGENGMQAVYKHLNTNDWRSRHHIDHHLGRLHMAKTVPVYCPREWLIGQAMGKSNISGRTHRKRFWSPADQSTKKISPAEHPFVAVIGLHSSGSSALAGVLHHLGMHLGNKLVGYYGSDPNKSCGFEAVGLVKLCERAMPFPRATIVIAAQPEFARRLKRFCNEKRREANTKGTLAAIKYPQLCRAGEHLINIFGNKLRVIRIDRPLEESIASICRRYPKKEPQQLRLHQEWLLAGRDELYGQLTDKQRITVQYADLLENPSREVERLISFLSIRPTAAQIAKAVDYVKPEQQHITSEPKLAKATA